MGITGALNFSDTAFQHEVASLSDDAHLILFALSTAIVLATCLLNRYSCWANRESVGRSRLTALGFVLALACALGALRAEFNVHTVLNKSIGRASAASARFRELELKGTLLRTDALQLQTLVRRASCPDPFGTQLTQEANQLRHSITDVVDRWHGLAGALEVPLAAYARDLGPVAVDATAGFGNFAADMHARVRRRALHVLAAICVAVLLGVLASVLQSHALTRLAVPMATAFALAAMALVTPGAAQTTLEISAWCVQPLQIVLQGLQSCPCSDVATFFLTCSGRNPIAASLGAANRSALALERTSQNLDRVGDFCTHGQAIAGAHSHATRVASALNEASKVVASCSHWNSEFVALRQDMCGSDTTGGTSADGTCQFGV